MKVALVGRNAHDLLPLIAEFGFELVADPRTAETIIAYGGDGTLIGSEHTYPGIKKIGLRDNRVCSKCARHADRDVLSRLARGQAPASELAKLVVSVRDKKLWGLNDVLLRNSDIRSAVRFSVHVNDEPVTDEIIGDGLVASTPFGSSAYFRSISNTTFREGIGLAFNNCTDFGNHMVLLPSDRVTVAIVRGPAHVTTDNNPEIITVDEGDRLEISRSSETARILAADTLRCGHCRYTNAPRRRF